MKKTYEVLKEICEANPTVTHILFRLYTNPNGLQNVQDDEFQYEWMSVTVVDTIGEEIDRFEKEGWFVGLASMVMTTSGIQHLLMLDYLVEQSAAAEGDLFWKLSAFNQSGDVSYKMDGYLIKTNNSYHYLSKYITTEENFINFLGSALLFRHSNENYFVIDDIWLGRSIKRRFGALRLGRKAGRFPEVLSEVK